MSKLSAFTLTFLGYASLSALRQGWSYSKSQLNQDQGVSMTYLGIVDFLYLICYSLGMIVLGSYVHKMSLKLYVVLGLLLSAGNFMLFALIYATTQYFNIALMTVFMCLTGFFHATGWPGTVSIMGNWFQKNKKGALMGFWAINSNFGNIVASYICNILQTNSFSWIWNFLVTGILATIVGVSMAIYLKDKPDPRPSQLAKIEQQQQMKLKQSEQNKQQINQHQDSSTSGYGILSLICLPRIPFYLIAYSCLKACIYGLIFWLPTFLDMKGNSIGDQKGYISAMLDVGSLIGGTFVGFLADHYNKRALFLSPLLLISSIILFIISFSLTVVPWQYYLCLFLLGVAIGGPYGLIGTVIAIQIGHILTEKSSVTKVSSLIEGSAAFFTAIEMVFIPYIPFDYIFYLFSFECIVATVILLPLFWEQWNQTSKKQLQVPLVQKKFQNVQMVETCKLQRIEQKQINK